MNHVRICPLFDNTVKVVLARSRDSGRDRIVAVAMRLRTVEQEKNWIGVSDVQILPV